MQIGQIHQRRLADTIVEQLESMILEGALQPGERLPAERVLATQFGVSRPSLREAMQKLAAKGLLVSRQGGGNYVAETLGSSFSDPLAALLGDHPEAQRDLLEFRHTLEADCAYYAALRATETDRQHLRAVYEALQASFALDGRAGRAEAGAADARFHLAIAEASHNVILLHTIRGLFDLLQRNTVTNIGDMYELRPETRGALMGQHRELFEAIIEGRAEDARQCANRHIGYVREVLAERREEAGRQARARRRERVLGR
ncbi:FCD domain-containing protein [Pseudothauera nasutitermitis]|uniref:Pyruvate dehydrogenase complex repressor n=1 Tax=Pseudothauera nasutitermitis TaxID=2565930 RepID=A0A4S4AT74_9RHOO|nr:FCD domain-containing protein [Pseudothauera nasutitermitis]THF63052.1 FCD domain-containing protein [Pseudothauera nasutitermitis]